MRRTLAVRIAAIALAAQMGVAMPVYAQSEAPAPDDGNAQATAAANGEIVVTARKREETLSDAPLAINAYGGAQLEQAAVGSLEDMEALVPGLVAQSTATSAGGILYLRGVGSSASNGLIDQAVAVNIDGVAMANAQLLQAGQYDMQQVEVLRGPQALFFGKNSPGGVISVTSKDPGRDFEASTTVGYELYAREIFGEGYVSGPVTDTLGLRLFGRYSNMDGYYKVVSADTPTSLASTRKRYTPSSDIFLRGTAVWEPGDRFTARAKLIYTRLKDEMGPQGQRIDCPTGAPQPNFGLTIIVPDACKLDREVITGSRRPALLTDPVLRNDADGFRVNEQWLASLDLDFAVTDDLTINSITGYYSLDDAYAGDFLMQAQNRVVATARIKSEQLSQELRLTSSFDGPLNFMVGGFAEKRDASGYLAIPPFGNASRDDYQQTQHAYSVFGELSFKLVENLVLSGGARYTHEVKKLDVSSPGFGGPIALPIDRLRFNDTSPQVTLAYYPSDDITLFASYKQGFKSGGFDIGSGVARRASLGATNTYKGEDVSGFEAGGKFTLADGALQLNVTAFSYDYKNLQVSLLDNVALSLSIKNAAAATVRGLEGEFIVTPRGVDGLTIRGNASYLDATYDQFLAGCFSGQTPAQGCSLRGSAGEPAQDLSGTRLLYAPEFSAGLGFSYETAIAASGMSLLFASDMNYSGSYETLQAQKPGSEQGEFAKINASISLRGPDKKWDLSLIGRNLTGKLTVANPADVPGTGSGTGTAAGIPADTHAFLNRRGREVLLRLRFDW
ncbi:MAG: hypothetical protein DI569_01315 [Sphingopyxis macrogoltabida]|uniref:TonB-dependent receptor n=1 Tax=Sphingopyxis macrogoltabida TaxID=33050 RepID=A0A2W5L7I9_SPHMC|nr:MAG: hypothetical protein DI569_01315 [Sphingopyxis macrogoltabida]